MNLDLSNPSREVIAEIVNRAASAGYDEWWAKVADSGFCAAPVRLVRGSSRQHAEVLARCKNRRASVCPSCSQLYAGDTWHLVHIGIAGDDKPLSVLSGRPMVFATLTAPSFGRVHTASRNRSDGSPRPCSPGLPGQSCRHGRSSVCRVVHQLGDPVLGEPLCTDCYDYVGHVLFTWHAPELWHRFAIGLRRLVARRCRDDGQEPSSVRVSYVKVVEMQRRAVPHFHTVIRLDGAATRGQAAHPPPTGLDSQDLAALVLRASSQVALRVETARSPVILWFGEQTDARPLIVDTGDALGLQSADSGRKVSAYLAKYVTKSVSDIGISARRLHPAVIDELHVSEHVRRILHTIVDLARQPGYQAIGARLHTLGYRGHVTTKTRQYSTTMGALRARREAWRKAQIGSYNAAVLAVEGAESLPRESQWRYVGCGHVTEGERLLVVSAAGRVREMRRTAREELADAPDGEDPE